MKKMLVCALVAVVALGGMAYASDAIVEKVMLLRIVEELDMMEYEMVEVLQEYNMYRDQMDGLLSQRDEKTAAIEAALAAEDTGFSYISTTRELMDLDMRILRLKQGIANEASQVMPADVVAKIYVTLTNMDKAKAALVAELTGVETMPCGIPAVCPLAVAAPAVAPEEAIMEHVVEFLGKLADKDIEAAMKGVADDFRHQEFGDKEDLAFFLEQALFMGYLDDVEVITDDTEVKIDGNKAIVYPVDLEGMFGSITLELVGEMRDGKWMLTSMDAIGI